MNRVLPANYSFSLGSLLALLVLILVIVFFATGALPPMLALLLGLLALSRLT